MQILDLSELQRGLPAITPAFGKALADAGEICLTDQSHKPEITFQVEGDFVEVGRIYLRKERIVEMS